MRLGAATVARRVVQPLQQTWLPKPLLRRAAVPTQPHCPRHLCRSSAPGNEPADTAPTGSAAASKTPEPEEEQLQASAPYLDGMLRASALGAGVGVLVELGHVMVQCAALGPTMPDIITNAVVITELLGPLRVWDNLAALTGTVFFYVVEVAAILAIMRQYPNDLKSAHKAIQSKVTLPKRLMPLSVQSARRALYRLMAGRTPLAAATAASSAPAPDIERQNVSGTTFASALGTAVLDRPPTQLPGAPEATAGGPAAPPTQGGGVDQAKAALERALAAPPASADKGRRPVLKKRPMLRPPAPPAAAPAIAGTTAPLAPSPGPSSVRAKLIHDRRAYLKNFWYAAALSSSLKRGRPMEVNILGRTIVLYRDSETGRPMCLDNVCPHRGAPLGKGWLKDVPTTAEPSAADASHSCAPSSSTCVVCPYHGWAFDSSGVLREVPSQEDQSSLPRRPLVDAYPVEEQGGFVWLFFGSSRLPVDQRPPIPTCPELDDPAWTKVYDELVIEAPHWGVFDNQIDFTHVHYIHDDSFGNKSKPTIRNMEVAIGEYGITANFRIHNKPSSAVWEWTATESVPIEAAAMLPSSSFVKNYLGAGVSMVVFTNTVPIDSQRSIVRLCLARNFAGWDGLDAWARNAMLKILREDKWVVELLRPEATRREVSLQADLPQVAFRKLRQSWVDMGYGVDPDQTQHHSGSLDV